MMATRLGVGQVLALVRESRRLDEVAGPVLVVGPLAGVLARSLAEGADDAGVVRTDGDPARAAAVVVLLAGAPSPDELTFLAAAERADAAIVAVQLDGNARGSVPYVFAEHVVTVPPGEALPVAAVAAALASALQERGVALARRLPVLRDPVEAWLVRRAVVRSAVIGAAPWTAEQQLPVLALGQARMVMELEAVSGAPRSDDPGELALSVGLPLATAFATGVLAREVYRRGPLHGRLAAAATAALGTLVVRRLALLVAARH